MQSDDIIDNDLPDYDDSSDLDSQDEFLDWIESIDALNARSSPLELMIINYGDPNIARYYAEHIVEGRWLEAEGIISKDPWAAACYAHDVIKKRWLEAEAIINSDPIASELYSSLSQ